MYYPPEFCEKVRRLFPNEKHMHKCLETGNALLGRFLDDSTTDSIYISAVLAANNLKDLKRRASEIQERRELWNEFWRLDREQFHKERDVQEART